MRSYKQKCGLAKALDLVGDRWTLLIVRELLIRGACRYTDLLRGLPGIASNMLADRLDEMAVAGIVVREEAPPPVATSLFRLSERGKELEAAILQLGFWGAPLLAGAESAEVFQAHWLVLPLKALLEDGRPADPDLEIELHIGDEFITISASKGAISVRAGAAQKPSVVLSGKPDTLIQLLSGKLDFQESLKAGVECKGSLGRLRRVIPTRKRRIAVERPSLAPLRS